MEKVDIEKVLGNLDNIQKASPVRGFYDRLLVRMELQEKQTEATLGLIWSAAAGIAALVALNVFIWMHTHSSYSGGKERVNPLAQEYFSYINNNSF